ncbi:MAG: hypothetical protein OIF32_08015 [Campylobacterales bacterium]|nr:hypothetical protein [Campylobacterales bacterium]
MKKLFLIISAFILTSCTFSDPDPLKNTKKLVKEGHISLYKNGAFKVPSTSIYLIPPGPEPLELAKELAGVKAKESFDVAIKKAYEAVYIIPKGTQLSKEVATDIFGTAESIGDGITNRSRTTGNLIIEKSFFHGKKYFTKSFENGLIGGEKVYQTGEDIEELFSYDETSGVNTGKNLIASSPESGFYVAKKGYRLGKDLTSTSIEIGKELARRGIVLGKEAIEEGFYVGAGTIKASNKLGIELIKKSPKTGKKIIDKSFSSANKIINSSSDVGRNLFNSSIKTATKINNYSEEKGKNNAIYAKDSFILGYAKLPKTLGKRADKINEYLTLDEFTQDYKIADKQREKNSLYFTEILSDTVDNYSRNVSSSFSKAKEELGTYKESGVAFASIKSLRWVLQGIFYDGLIKPITNLTTGSLGYIAVNGVVFPVMVVTNNGITMSKIAVGVTYNSAIGAYEIVAPTAEASLAGLLSTAQYIGGKVASTAVIGAGTVGSAGIIGGGTVLGAGATVGQVAVGSGVAAGGTAIGTGIVAGKTIEGGARAVGGTIAGAGVSAGGTVAGGATVAGGVIAGGGTTAGKAILGTGVIAGNYGAKGAIESTGFVLGKGVKYIGAPITTAGITISQASYGVVAGGVGVTAGSGVVAIGEISSLTTKTVGGVAAGGTFVGGTTASVVTGTGLGAYQLSKAVVVPAGYTLSSGVVLSYGTVSHLSAHAILGVSDAAYLVLSLEGPKWVVYAVTGNLKDDDNIIEGAVVDLEKIQNRGSIIKRVELNKEQIEKVVQSTYSTKEVQ